MNIFYIRGLKGDTGIMDSVESTHCIRVLRHRKGDAVRLIDGTGGFYRAEIINDDPRECKVKILEYISEFEKPGYQLHIAIAPTKNADRFEWFLEKACEIGVSSITPLICSRSERKKVRLDRMNKIILSAIKQSVKAYLPTISAPVKFSEWIQGNHEGTRLIAHCQDDAREDIWDIKPEENTTIMIGPEGDFTNDEISKSLEAGFRPISLGHQRLRTETAGVVACSAVYLLNRKQ